MQLSANVILFIYGPFQHSHFHCQLHRAEKIYTEIKILQRGLVPGECLFSEYFAHRLLHNVGAMSWSRM